VVVGEILVVAIRADEVVQAPIELVAGEVEPMDYFLEVRERAEVGAVAVVADSSTGIQFLTQCMGCKARRCMECKCMGSFRRVELE